MRLFYICLVGAVLWGSSVWARTWTNIKGDQVEAEFGGVTQKGGSTQVQMIKANGQTFSYALSNLSEADQLFVAEQLQKEAAAKQSAADEKDSVALTAFEESFADKLVSLQKRKLAPASLDNVGKVEYYAFYFSAHWCPPCRAFTPDLSKFHRRYKKRENFEIIFVSSDKNEEAMTEYMEWGDMDFLAIAYDQKSKVKKVKALAGSSIPHLVITDREGAVIHNSYENGQRVGPGKALDALEDKVKGR